MVAGSLRKNQRQRRRLLTTRVLLLPLSSPRCVACTARSVVCRRQSAGTKSKQYSVRKHSLTALRVRNGRDEMAQRELINLQRLESNHTWYAERCGHFQYLGSSLFMNTVHITCTSRQRDLEQELSRTRTHQGLHHPTAPPPRREVALRVRASCSE